MTDPRPRLTAALITRNEAQDLAACLESVSFCDEIVVVDNGSTDGTVAIAERFGARVLVTEDWPGFGPQKQRALDMATGTWVLSIDADERIPDDLRHEILAAVDTPAGGFRINRRTYFLGKPLAHGGWYPDRVLRLVRRDTARFTPDVVHEQLLVEGPLGDLQADMLHLSYRSIADLLEKQRRYALASADRRRSEGRSGGLALALARSAWTFLRLYALKAGFLDGAHGFVAAAAKAQETFWRYLAVGWER